MINTVYKTKKLVRVSYSSSTIHSLRAATPGRELKLYQAWQVFADGNTCKFSRSTYNVYFFETAPSAPITIGETEVFLCQILSQVQFSNLGISLSLYSCLEVDFCM